MKQLVWCVGSDACVSPHWRLERVPVQRKGGCAWGTHIEGGTGTHMEIVRGGAELRTHERKSALQFSFHETRESAQLGEKARAHDEADGCCGGSTSELRERVNSCPGCAADEIQRE